MTATKPKALKFQEYACLIDVSFWQYVIHKKLNVWKLDCPPLPLVGSLETAAGSTSRPVIRLDASSPSMSEDPTGSPSLVGCFHHVNTLEEFRSFPFSAAIANSTKNALRFIRHQEARRHMDDTDLKLKTRDSMVNKDPSMRRSVSLAARALPVSDEDNSTVEWEWLFKNVLNPFFIVAYMNLKQYSVIYCVACPTFGFKKILTKVDLLPPLSIIESPKSPEEPKPIPMSVRYTVTRPAIPATKEFSVSEITHVGRHLKDLCCCHNSQQNRRSTAMACLLVKSSNQYYSLADIPSAIQLRSAEISLGRSSDIYLCVRDFSKCSNAISWPTRNLLFTLCSILKLYDIELKLFCYRDSLTLAGRLPPSRIFFIKTPPEEFFVSNIVVWAGWLLNRSQPDSIPALPPTFSLNLQSFLDTTTVQQEATELNVKLIKWRILPAFDPQRLKSMRFLIIGMGTLGCHLARDLVGWGVTKFTLIDCGTISPSNPARQSLYIAKDVGSSPSKKVLVARQRLLEIRGDLEVETYDFEIPMPNQQRFLIPYDQFIGAMDQATPLTTECYAIWVEQKLRQLISNHEVVLLLTDTRESRWLPALIAQSMSYRAYRDDKATIQNRLQNPFCPPLCLTVALGFDTYVVIRHGSFADSLVPPEDLPTQQEEPFQREDVLRSRLSCYFCNDLSAPSAMESRYRTLDQQCTVTRTGVAGLASAVSVELLSTLSQAPYGFGMMPGDRRQQMARQKSPDTLLEKVLRDEGHLSCLGDAPHVTRGSVSTFKMTSDWHANFERCVCCSSAVQEAYYQQGSQFVRDVITDSQVLEIASGLYDLRNNERCLEAMLSLEEFPEGTSPDDET